MYKQKRNPFNSPVVKVDMEDGVLGKANDDGTIHINKNVTDPKQIKDIVEHESVHIDQMKRGDLSYNDNNVFWKGKKYSRSKMNEGAKNLPWEKEAYEKAGRGKFNMDGYRGNMDSYSPLTKKGLINSPLNNEDPPNGTTLPTAEKEVSYIDQLLSKAKKENGNYSLGKTKHLGSGNTVGENTVEGMRKRIGGKGFDTQSEYMGRLRGINPNSSKFYKFKNELRDDSATMAANYKLASGSYNFLDQIKEQDGVKSFSVDGSKYTSRLNNKTGKNEFSVIDPVTKTPSKYYDYDNPELGKSFKSKITQYGKSRFKEEWNKSEASKSLNKYNMTTDQGDVSYNFHPANFGDGQQGSFTTPGLDNNFSMGSQDDKIKSASNKIKGKSILSTNVLPTSSISSKPKNSVTGPSINDGEDE